MPNNNVTEEQFKGYLEIFHHTLKSTASDSLPSNIQSRLIHLAYLPAKIMGYVSTQYGIAIEYIPAETTIFEVRRGSARAEDLLFQAPLRVSKKNPFIRNFGRNNRLVNPSFENRFPVRLGGNDASLFLENALCKDGDWTRHIRYAELYSDRSGNFWSKENAVARAKNEVIAALVYINRAREQKREYEEFITATKEKWVLVLGSYDQPGMVRLDSIKRTLRELKFEPIILEDVPDHPQQSLQQKVLVLSQLSRFVVVEDSFPSGHLSEVQLCVQGSCPTVLLRAHGKAASYMTVGLGDSSRMILEKDYNPDSLLADLSEAVEWAENLIRELQIKRNIHYPWRSAEGV